MFGHATYGTGVDLFFRTSLKSLLRDILIFFTANSRIPLVDSISVTCAPIFWSLTPHFMAYLGTLVGYGNSL